MADLTNLQGSTPVEIINESSGNSVIIELDGSICTHQDAPEIASYSAAAVGLVTTATATDVFTITGSSTKTIKITRIAFSGSTTAGSGIGFNCQLIKRSTANSGGTSSTLTNVPNDSSNAAATATVRSYTANPTVGTAVGTIRAIRYSTTATGAVTTQVEWDFGVRPAQPIVLRGTSEVLAINFSSTTITGPIFNFGIEWTEE